MSIFKILARGATAEADAVRPSSAVATIAGRLRDQGVVVYAHTVNDPALFAELSDFGVFGIYTDEIAPTPP